MARFPPLVVSVSGVWDPMASSIKCAAMAWSVGDASLCVSDGVCSSSCDNGGAVRSGCPTLDGSLQPMFYSIA